MGPKVSVIVVTYFRNDDLKRCLESIHKQSYEDIEIVVVDSSGKKFAQEVVNNFNEDKHEIKYIPQEQDRGLTYAREVGINNSTGDLIHFIDDDDEFSEDSINKKVKKISKEIGVVYSGIKWESGQEVLPDDDVKGDVLKYALALQMAPCLPSTMLIKKSIISDMKPQQQLPHDDAARKIELAQRTKFDYVNEPLVIRGAPDDSRGSSRDDLYERRNTINEYNNLYKQFHPRVERTALSRTYVQECQILLNEQSWSLQAIVAAAKACYIAPGVPPVYIAAFFASLGGKSGWDYGFSVYSSMVDDRNGNIGAIDV